MNQFEGYSDNFDGVQHDICSRLCDIINEKLRNSASKLYHGAPVWFIDGNPIVGYSKKKNGIALLFWSGQSFSGKGLSRIGSFKAAEKMYKEVEEIKENELNGWLEESMSLIWDYKNVRLNNGILKRA